MSDFTIWCHLVMAGHWEIPELPWRAISGRLSSHVASVEERQCVVTLVFIIIIITITIIIIMFGESIWMFAGEHFPYPPG